MKFGLEYPRSFRRLLALGFALVVLPLALGLVGNAVSIRQLSAKSRDAVYAAVRITQTTRTLIENLSAQERAVRQYEILHDRRLFDIYQTLHASFGELVARLGEMPLADEQRAALERLAEEEVRLNAALGQPQAAPPRGRPVPKAGAADPFPALAEAAQELVRQNTRIVDSEVEDLQALAAKVEQAMIVQLLALLPVAVFLVLGFTRLLAGPVAQLEAAIGILWAGRFDRKIAVGGPTDLRALGEQLDRLRLRLMQLEERKSRFLRQISHEIKTPLAALCEGANLLAEGAVGPLSEQQKEVVGILAANSRRMQQLIEDLLAYSAADFEQSVLHRQVFPLRELIAAVVESQRLALAARDLRVDTDAEELAVDADRERIRTVIDNLLSNAIKYSPRSAAITLLARREGEEAIIEVADQGPGIAEEDRERVFDPFYQGRLRADSLVKGSGLGLSIAQEHVLAHGGRLLLMPGPGARFQVRLPLPWR